MKITAAKLKEILDKHLKWYLGLEGGERADLSGADLSGADLSGANLSRANLSGANLSGANLSRANLSGADLSGANLSGANLSGANLSRADLSGANLSRANLSGANLSMADLSGANLSRANLSRANLSGANLSMADLSGANLSGANLSRANLSGANLSGANLSMADLSGANLSGANLSGANLYGAENFWLPMTCPDAGSFIGWKKAVLLDANGDWAGNVIVKLRICEDAKRSSSTGRKCRCDKAEVLGIQALDGGKPSDGSVVSDCDRNFHYIPGTIVSVPDFDENRWKECSTGIHFFINRQDAVDYIL